MEDESALREDFDFFRKKLGEMVKRGTEGSMEPGDPLQSSLVEGEAGSYGLALDYLEEVTRKGSSVSLQGIQEAYYNLLVAYNRMHGAALALERIIKEMQTLFDLPEEEAG